MVILQNVTKRYKQTNAIDNLSLSIEPGRIYALLGPNSSGKTTMMKLIAGLTKPNWGMITFNKADIGSYSKSQIAFMPTENYFHSYMTCSDVGKYYSDFFTDFNIEKFEELLDKFELNKKSKVGALSTGMLAKLKLSANLSRDAKLVMLDEPLNGIDILSRETVINTIIDSFTPEKAFIISSHIVEELEQVVDSVIFLDKGQLKVTGLADELRQSKNKSLVEIYKEIYGGGYDVKTN